MNQDEMVALVKRVAGVTGSEITRKERDGSQIKANGLWEGSCSPTSPRKRVGLFLARDGDDLAVEGAIRRLSLRVPYPEAIVVLFGIGEASSRAEVFGYADSAIATHLATAFDVELTTVARPSYSADTPPPATLDASVLAQNLLDTPNVIVQGPPGTGKTSLALEIVRSHASRSGMTLDECRFGRLLDKAGGDIEGLIANLAATADPPPIVWELVQGHPGYSYDDLVRRIVPKSDGTMLAFTVEDRLLPHLCRVAEQRGDGMPVLLILDEINRCNLPATLGEFIFAIDPGHRGTPVRLQYQGSDLPPTVAVPPNLWIVGTMNTADRSLAVVDYAIRRRFRFLDVAASPDTVADSYPAHPTLGAEARALFDACNEGLPRRLQVGHSYFMVDPTPDDTWPDRMARQVAFHAVPLLAEYAQEGLRSDGVLRYRGLELRLIEQANIASALATTLRQALANDQPTA